MNPRIKSSTETALASDQIGAAGLGSADPICSRFEDQWRLGQSPSLRSYLRDLAKQRFPARFEPSMFELVKIDMEYRWSMDSELIPGIDAVAGAQELGDGVLPRWPRLDDYVREYPELGSASDVPIELICLEYRLRCERGESPRAEEYFDRYKQRSDILDILKVVDDLESSTRAPRNGSQAQPRQIQLSCPHCRESVFTDDDESRAVMCSHCGRTIRLVGGAPMPKLDNDRFVFIDRLGIGGFGTVWKALDTKLDRVVALKLPRRSQLEGREMEKFLREARAAAQLRHDNIVAVHDFSRTGDDCFIVSELVEGVALSKWLNDHELSYMQAAKLCKTVAIALDYAHRHGIVHRDLKPSNIIVDNQLVPYITDFGLAKRDSGEVTMTCDGQVLGTPAYMSPEQANGHGHDADGRADIYALGVVLYRLLTGELPFRGNVHMMIHHVIHDDPVSPRQLNHRIPRDLETICLKCLEKEPSRRFQTAGELVEELERFQKGEPIKSRPRSAPMRAWRWVTRHRMAALVGLLLLLFCSAGPTAVVLVRRTIEREEDSRYQSLRERARAEVVSQQPGYRERVRAIVGEAVKLGVPGGHAELRGLAVQSMGDFVGFEPLAIPVDPEAIALSVAFDQAETRLAVGFMHGSVKIFSAQNGKLIDSYTAHVDHVRALRFEEGKSNDAVAVVSVDKSGRVVCRKVIVGAEEPGDVLTQLELPDGSTIKTAHFSTDGQWLVAQVLNERSSVGVWNTRTWERVQPYFSPQNTSRTISNACISPDGRYVAVGYFDADTHRCGFSLGDLKTNEYQDVVAGEGFSSPNGIGFTHDGKYLVFGCNELFIYDVERRQAKGSWKCNEVQAVASSSDGRYIANYVNSGVVEIRDASSFEILADCISPAITKGWFQFGLFFSPNSGLLASTCSDTLQVWDLNAARERIRVVGHRGAVAAVAFSPDEKLMASASFDGTVGIWDVATGLLEHLLPLHGSIHGVAFNRDGRYLAAASRDGSSEKIDVWSTRNWWPVSSFTHDFGSVASLRFHPDHDTLVASCVDVSAKAEKSGLGIWRMREISDSDVAFDLINHELGHHRALHVEISPNGEHLAWVSSKRVQVRRWDEANSLVLGGHDQSILLDGWHALTFFPDGRRVVLVGHERYLEIWDVVTNCRVEQLVDCGQFVSSLVALSPNGRWLATKSGNRNVNVAIWDTRSWEKVMVLPAERTMVRSVAWHPNSQKLAIGTDSGLMSIWDIAAVNAELESLGLAID